MDRCLDCWHDDREECIGRRHRAGACPAGGTGSVPATKARIAAGGHRAGARTVLIDSHKEPFDLEKLRGKVVLVSFVYTTCNGVCPLTTQALAGVRKELETAKLWGKSVEFVSITLDPGATRRKSSMTTPSCGMRTWRAGIS